MKNITKSFKIKNPYRADQEIRQEVNISDDLVYDYDGVEWMAVDTEYLSLDMYRDQLCVVQVGSMKDGVLRVEILPVYNKTAGEKLISVLINPDIEKLFHVYSSDVPRLEKFIGQRLGGKFFDTKVAARITWTNTQNHGMKSLLKMFVDPNFDQRDNIYLGDWEIAPEEWSNDQVYYMMQDVLYLDALRKNILKMANRRGKKELVEEIMTTLPALSQLYLAGYKESVLGY